MNTTNKRTQISEMKPGCSLPEQTPYMPEGILWGRVFQTLENEYWKICFQNNYQIYNKINNRRDFKALGLTCKAIYNIFLPKEIALCKRVAEFKIEEDDWYYGKGYVANFNRSGDRNVRISNEIGYK